MKIRLVYISLTMLCFTACVLIVKLFSDNQLVRGFVGDIIVVSLVYFLIKSFYDFHGLKLAVFTLTIAFTTEFLQYFRLTTFLGLEHNAAARMILGAVFDPYDLIAYAIGAVSVYIIDTRLIRRIIL